MKPLFDKVLISIEKEATHTSSGIILVNNDDKKLEQATVLAIGPDVVTLQVGDTILFKSYSADTIELNGKEISFIKEEDALAVV